VRFLLGPDDNPDAFADTLAVALQAEYPSFDVTILHKVEQVGEEQSIVTTFQVWFLAYDSDPTIIPDQTSLEGVLKDNGAYAGILVEYGETGTDDNSASGNYYHNQYLTSLLLTAIVGNL
jgi:hypothetical protein